MQTWLFLIIAAASGILMALQGSLNSALSKVIGVLEGSLVVHLLGLLTVAVLLYLCGLGRAIWAGSERRPGTSIWAASSTRPSFTG